MEESKGVQGEGAFRVSGKILPVLALLAAVAAFAVFLPALGNGFVQWDDPDYVYNNLNIRSIDAHFFKWAATAVVAANWHPLTVFSLALDYAVWGLNPLGYHLTNNIFHAVNTALVAVLGFRLAARAIGTDNEAREPGRNTRIAVAGFTAAILFAVHPLHVESVAWVAERKDVLSAFFFLLSVYLFTGYIEKERASRPLYYAASFVCFLLSLMSKPMAVTLPVVLLILDYYPYRRIFDYSTAMSFGRSFQAAGGSGGFPGGVRRVVLEKAPFFILSIIWAGLTLWVQKTSGAVRTLDALSFSERLLGAFRGYAFYLYKTVLPVGLAPHYPRPEEITPANPEYLVSIALFALITIICIVTIKRQKILTAVWACYLSTLLPVIGIIQVGDQAAADRYMYLPGIAVFLLAGAVASAGAGRSRGGLFAASGATVAATAVLAVLTVMQTSVWTDTVTLWNRQISIYPDSSPVAYNNLGNIYRERGDMERALYNYNKAIEISPGMSLPYSNRGVIYMRAGDFRRALSDLSTAVELNPAGVESLSNRGVVYLNMGDYASALRDFTAAMDSGPDSFQASRLLVNRAYAYSSLGQTGRAAADLNAAIRTDPEFAFAYNARGELKMQKGDYRSAAEDFLTATRLEPSLGPAYRNLASAYDALGERGLAAQARSRAGALGVR